MKTIVLLAIVSCFHGALGQDDWTEEDFDSLKNVLSSWISEDEDRAPASLRFAFHTCVGGCDGCINMEDDLNLGLDEVYEPINELYSEIFPFSEKQLELSRADFWALAGIVGVEYTIGLNNQVCEGDPVCVMKEPNFQYTYGREDCLTSPDLPSDAIVGIPVGFFDYDMVMDFFSEEFGLDPTESAALLGSHTIGSMERSNSGYTGSWKVGEELEFNNKYYRNLVSRQLEWEQFDAAEGDGGDETGEIKFMWRGNNLDDGLGDAFALNSDMCLLRDIQIEDEGGESSCDFNECNPSPTSNLVNFFAENQDVWLDVFTLAYDKMTANVADGIALKKPTKA